MKLSPYLFPARALALGALLFATSQCSVSEQVKESPSGRSSAVAASRDEQRENKAYELVQYRLNFVDEARLAGQDILFVRQPTDLTPPQQAKLQTALQAGLLPLKLRMRVYARNSSKEDLQLKQFDYKLLLDGRELTTGSTGANTAMESSAIVTLPINVDVNVPQELTAGSTPAAFASGLADFTGANRRLTMQIRPTYINAAGRVTQPGDFVPVDLITVKK